MEDFPASPAESASLEIVARIQRGDDAAWEDLYERYHDQLLLVVRMRLGTALRAHLQSEDVFQSVAADAIRALHRFEYRGPGSLERYLKTMILNKIRDRADRFGALKRAGEVPLSRADDLPAPGKAPQYHDPDSYERLERALQQLPEDLREVLVMRKLEGLSSREVAERTGRTDAAVRKATSRALARLTTLMDSD